MNFFRPTDTTDTTIWKPGFTVPERSGEGIVAPTKFDVSKTSRNLTFDLDKKHSRRLLVCLQEKPRSSHFSEFVSFRFCVKRTRASLIQGRN